MSRLLKVALLLAGFVLPMTASLGGTTVGGGTNSPDVIRIKIPAAAPEGSTGTCKDGTYTMTEMQAKECAAHGGPIRHWNNRYGAVRKNLSKRTP